MRPGDLVFDRFEIEEKAGAGAMGTVWRAKDRTTGLRVALKVLAAREAVDAERFGREGAVLAALAHPGIVRYVANGTRAGEHFLAMEWLEGEDLAARLERLPPTVGEAVALVRAVAEALGVAHKRGIIHRDVKPSNLFLVGCDLGRLKILDFGIARLTRDRRGPTLTGAMLGTPGYMAPEQAQGARDLDARADVFSLGAVLFKCVAGRAPFTGENLLAVLAKTILEDAPRLADVRDDVPPPLDALVARLLAKDPAARPQDSAAVVREIDQLGDLSGIPAPPSDGRVALTANERRVVCVVLVGGASGLDEEAATIASDRFSARQGALRDSVASHGGRLDELPDGSLLVTLSGTGAATDQAVRAARCALELRGLMPRVPMALATGGAMSSAARGPGPGSSDLVDRGVRLLARPVRERTVWLDDATAGLLDSRFDVRESDGALYLAGERHHVDATRTLLGKPYECVGREREIAFLESLFDECSAEPIARAVLVTAPAGRGKSRIRFELLETIKRKERRALVLFGRGDELSAGSPFGMLAPALRRSIGILEDDSPEVKQRRLRARLARHVAGDELDRATAFLGELMNVPAPDEGHEALRAARRDALLMGDAMLSAWLAFLEAECEERPVAIVLEDLHWGDLPSVRFVDAALGALSARPLYVLALARPEVHASFPGLWADREVQELKLGPLTPRASERLARAALGQAVDDRTLGQVVERSGGNVFYLEELIRAVAGGASGAVLPDTVLGMVQARLDALGNEAKRVLRAASVFGQIFWRGGLVALLGGGAQEASVKEWLDDLVQREVIAPRGAARTFQGEAEYIFRHALLRDAAYAMLTDRDRVLGHRLAGGWLERAGETDAMILAEHFDRGDEPWKSAGWYRRAAEHALEGNDLAAALARTERGIALAKMARERRASSEPPPLELRHRSDAGSHRAAREAEPQLTGPPSRPGRARTPLDAAAHARREERRMEDVVGVLRLLSAEGHKWRGELAEALSDGQEAASRLDPAGDSWFRAVGEVIAVAGQRGEVATVARWVEEAATTTMAESALTAQVVCLCRGVSALLHGGLYGEADALLGQIERVAGDTKALDRVAAARVHQARATRALQGGSVERALREYEVTLEAFDLAGDRRNAALTRISLAVARAELGELERAEVLARKALAQAERMGLANVAAWAQNNLGNALGRLGRRDEARAVLERALAAGETQKNLRLETSTLVYLAWMALAAGEIEVAERHARTGAERAAHLPPLRAPVLATLARILLARGNGHETEARAHAAEALSVLESLGGGVEGEGMVRLAFAESLAAAGDAEPARLAARSARDRLLARADRIEDAALRASFLERVWENQRTLELAASLAS